MFTFTRYARLHTKNIFIFFVISVMSACTFNNSLTSGDYIQQPKSVKKSSGLVNAHLYVTCTTFAKNYDQVSKTVSCASLPLSGIDDSSVLEEIVGNFNSLQFDAPLKDFNLAKPSAVTATKIVHLDIYEQYGWPRLAFQALCSTLTLTLIPFNYPRSYTITMSLQDANGIVERSASRQVSMDNWWWAPLMFAYPFYNEKRAGENMLLHTGRDLIHELEIENAERR